MSEEKEVMVEEREGKVKEGAKKKGNLLSAKLEIIVVVFLGITALLTAWATWIGSLHGGNQATNYTTSNNIAADGNSRYNEGVQNMNQDMLLWNEISDLQLEIVYAQEIGDDVTAELAAYKLYYKANDNFSERMAAKLGWDFEAAAESNPTEYVNTWLSQEESGVSPFVDEAFTSAYFEDALAVLEEANECLEQGKEDNAHGDSFNLVTVMYSVVLFLLGIVGTFKDERNKLILVIISLVVLVVATIYMFTIPMPTGFSFANFFVH